MSKFKVLEVSSNEVTQEGFAKFNNGPHLCVSVPSGHSTITVVTPDGKQITFAFLPYEPEGNPKCVDIHHATGESIEYTNVFGEKLNVKRQDVMLFGNGSYKDPYSYNEYNKQEGNENKPHTLTSVILERA